MACNKKMEDYRRLTQQKSEKVCKNCGKTYWSNYYGEGITYMLCDPCAKKA